MKNYFRILAWLFLGTVVSCNTEDPKPGADGLTSLLKVSNEASGLNCVAGGTRIDAGIDKNKNGILDSEEIQSTVYVCNGNSGTNSLINVSLEPAGANCTKGGFKIDTGLDLNKNGVLDNSEIAKTVYVCNGNDGFNSLINVTPEPAGVNCANGGFKIDTGLDLNKDGILGVNEITKTVYDCNDFEIGMNYGGGIIFYLDGSKRHGLIAAKNDQATVEWSTLSTAINAGGIAFGTGQLNTSTIVSILGNGNYAAILCDQLVLDGFSDWFLPSRDELNYLYSQKPIVGGFADEYYWSSTETAEDTAWGQLFSNGFQNSSLAKSNQLKIRAIRSF